MNEVNSSRTFRSWLIVFCLLVLLVGIGLIYFPRTIYKNITLSGQTTTCQRTLLTRLTPHSSSQGRCATSAGSWYIFSLSSNSNITATVLFNQSSTGVVTPLYNETATTFFLDLPANTSGVVIFELNNIQNNFVRINGQLSVYTAAQSQYAMAVPEHPYRLYGAALVALSVFGVFMLSWNPAGIATLTLQRLGFGWKNFKLRSSNFIRGLKSKQKGEGG